MTEMQGAQEKFCEPYKRTVGKILSQRNAADSLYLSF